MPTTIRSESAKDAWIRLILGLGFLAIGGYVVYLAIEMVGIFGEGMGIDAASRKIYSHAHVAVHVFGTASALAVGWFILAKKRWLATLAGVAILGCGGYGIINMIGFTTTNRLSVSEARTAANSSEWKMYENARLDLQRHIKWLEGQAVEADSPREKRRMFAEMDAKRRELSAIQPPRPTAANVLADPQATWFSRLTGWAAENWQLALPVPVAFLLFTAEVLSFVFATYLIAGAVESLRSVASKKDDDASSNEGGGGGSKPRLAYDANAAHGANSASMQPAKIAVGAEYSTSAAAMQTMQRSVPGVSWTDAGKKPAPAGLSDYLQEYAKGHGPRRTQSDIARDFGTSQPTVSRQLRRAQERAGRKAARQNMQHTGGYAGFGGSMHAPAAG